MSLWINGEWWFGCGSGFSKQDLVNLKVVWQGEVVDVGQVVEVVVVVCQVFLFWVWLLFVVCQVIVEKFVVLLEVSKVELMVVIGVEIGKLCWEVVGEVMVMINKVVILVKVYYVCIGEQYSDLFDGVVMLCYWLYGVLVVFGFYNFFGYLLNGYIVLVLLVGNIVVFKFSEFILCSGEVVVKLWQQVGLFVGVFNLVQGGWEIGEVFSGQVDIDGLLFIGSLIIGFYLYCQLVGQLQKIFVLEMGGNNLLIVDDLRDVDVVVYLIIQFVFIIVGQCCICVCCLLVWCGEVGDVFFFWLVMVSQWLILVVWDVELQLFFGGFIFE